MGGRAGDGSVGESACFPAWQPSSVSRIQRWREFWQVRLPPTLEKNIKIEENHYRSALGNSWHLPSALWWQSPSFVLLMSSACPLALLPCSLDSPVPGAPSSALVWLTSDTYNLTSLFPPVDRTRNWMQRIYAGDVTRVSVKTNTVENSTLFC